MMKVTRVLLFNACFPVKHSSQLRYFLISKSSSQTGHKAAKEEAQKESEEDKEHKEHKEQQARQIHSEYFH
jgi:hypothetical protein